MSSTDAVAFARSRILREPPPVGTRPKTTWRTYQFPHAEGDELRRLIRAAGVSQGTAPEIVARAVWLTHKAECDGYVTKGRRRVEVPATVTTTPSTEPLIGAAMLVLNA